MNKKTIKCFNPKCNAIIPESILTDDYMWKQGRVVCCSLECFKQTCGKNSLNKKYDEIESEIFHRDTNNKPWVENH